MMKYRYEAGDRVRIRVSGSPELIGVEGVIVKQTPGLTYEVKVEIREENLCCSDYALDPVDQ